MIAGSSSGQAKPQRPHKASQASQGLTGAGEKRAHLGRDGCGVGLQVERRYAGDDRAGHGGAGSRDVGGLCIEHRAAHLHARRIHVHTGPVVAVVPPPIARVRRRHCDRPWHLCRADAACICLAGHNISYRKLRCFKLKKRPLVNALKWHNKLRWQALFRASDLPVSRHSWGTYALSHASPRGL